MTVGVNYAEKFAYTFSYKSSLTESVRNAVIPFQQVFAATRLGSTVYSFMTQYSMLGTDASRAAGFVYVTLRCLASFRE